MSTLGIHHGLHFLQDGVDVDPEVDVDIGHLCNQLHQVRRVEAARRKGDVARLDCQGNTVSPLVDEVVGAGVETGLGFEVGRAGPG